MKLKKEYAILAVVIAVLISYLILYKKDRTHYQLPVVSEIKKNRITQIEIGNPGGSVILNRKDKTWYIGPEEYLADSDKVKNMLDVIEKLTVTALASESKNYFRYDLNNDKKITVKAWDGNTIIRKFNIGKSATTYRHTFIKLEKDSNVYHARGDFRHSFDQALDKLRDKNVLSFEKNDIHEIQMLNDKKTILVKRKEQPVVDNEKKGNETNPSAAKEHGMIWQTVEGRQLDKSKLERLLSSLSRLDCEKYIDGGKKEDFVNPSFIIKLKGDAKDYTLSVFSKTNKDATTVPAVSSENHYPFLLSDFQVDDFKKTMEEILKKEEGY